MLFTVTITVAVPDVAALGTSATIWPLLQLLMDVAGTPLNHTLLVPCVAPKFVPVTVTEVPIGPMVGDTLETDGVGVTVTLSNVAGSRYPDPLTARPMYTVVGIVIVAVPSCVQLFPSGEPY